MVNNPLLLDAQTNFLWVNDTYLMFTEQQELRPSFHTKGFALYEDLFDRWGWIATNEEGNESITFEIDHPTLGRKHATPKLFKKNMSPERRQKQQKRMDQKSCFIPYLSVLKSYENMGQMTVTIHDRIKDRETMVEIDSLWKPRISVPSDVQLIAANNPWDEQELGCSANCSITITSKPLVEGRTGNKIKLLTLSVRPCIPRELHP